MASVKRKRASSPSPSSSSMYQRKYDVFLSFKGGDTRNTFTDHLYDALQRKGIITFRDEEGLERGESIAFELFKAIEESQFAIIILSKNYASSKWCLDELAKIIKCRKEMRLIVFPVFYNVDPSDVRKQTGIFEQAFIDHQKCFEDNIEKVQTWRAALREVADISGWHKKNRHESKFIQDIVKVMMEKLSSKFSSITTNLIRIESTLANFIPSYLGFENNVRMIGIYGMGGLGKTTLARIVYDKFRSHFDGSSFIANIREESKKHGLLILQKQLLADTLVGKKIRVSNVYDGVEMIMKRLRYKKVLLVIDDVDHLDQLKYLVGDHGWFGLGSWIIITTRDEHVLIQHGVTKRYNPNGLNNDDALKLFCLEAFKSEQPKKGYMQLSQQVVKYANGLPLALVTLGSFLVGRTIDQWQSALHSFKKNKGEIFKILKISYDGLEEMWREIFLDIACFFRQWKKNQVIQILENCGFNAIIGIPVLMEKSLISIDDDECLRMHDLLQEMGEKIVRFESSGKQSRLWLIEDLHRVLENDMATEAIQAIVVGYKENDFNFEEFLKVLSSKMSNFRLMIIEETNYCYDPGDLAVPNNQRQLFVPNQLRHLSWSYCPLKCLSSSSQRKELVQLDLRESKIEYLWEGVMRSVNLKFINLVDSHNLIRTPDFSGVPMLEGLDLSGCNSLVEIHPSIGQLSKLKYLLLEGCHSLTNLPCMYAVMQSLTMLELAHCYKFSLFPKFAGIMKSLSTLNLFGTDIKKVEPSSIECLTALTFLDLSACTNLEYLPSNMDNLRSLQTLNLLFCLKLKSLPRLPSSVRFMGAKGCSSLKWSPEWVKLSIWSQPFSQWLPYDESGSQVGFTKLFYFLQGLICRKAVLDGSIISSRLAVKEGNSISIKLPSNWYNSKWIGFALWASLSSVEDVDVKYGVRARVIAHGDMPQNHCASEHFTTYIRDENSICLLYLSRDDWFATVGNDKCSQIKVIFEYKKSYIYDHQKKSTIYIRGECGVGLIYKQGVDKFNKTDLHCLIKSFGEVSIYKLTASDDDDDNDVHMVNDDDDDVYIVGDDDDDNVRIVGDDDFDDDDI